MLVRIHSTVGEQTRFKDTQYKCPFTDYHDGFSVSASGKRISGSISDRSTLCRVLIRNQALGPEGWGSFPLLARCWGGREGGRRVAEQHSVRRRLSPNTEGWMLDKQLQCAAPSACLSCWLPKHISQLLRASITKYCNSS